MFFNPSFFGNNLNLIYVLVGLSFLGLLVLALFVFSLIRKYRRLVKDVTGSNLSEIWLTHLATLEKAQINLNELRRLVGKIEEDNKNHFQRFGLVRFNPFDDTGGNQSFAIALLNLLGDGVVFSSLHGREGTRVYGKNVKEFSTGEFEFSTEEKEAINRARESQN